MGVASRIIPRPGVAEPLPCIAGGSGIYLTDANGKQYLDGSGGAAVSCLGHNHPVVVAAVKQQLDRIAYAHTSFFTSQPAEALAEQLVALAPPGIDRVYFVCGGSEAVEAGIKLARQYHVARDEGKRRLVIGRRQSYHGNTLGALAVGSNRARQALYEPLLFTGAHHIDPCYAWRWQRANETAAAYGERTAQQLEEKILALGAENVAAFIAETVVGATLGAVPAEPGYFRRIRDICNRYGVLLILDEVMCGAGRTGTFFACEQEGIAPDIVCIAKGLGGGVQPLGAMLCAGAVYDAAASSGGFQHGHTYLSHAAACAAGASVVGEVVSGGLLANVVARGEQLRRLLREQLGEHPHVGDIRGRGLFVGVELVADRASKQAFATGEQVHQKIKHAALARGLMVYAMGGTVDGQTGDHVLIAPPYIINASQVEELATRFAAATTATLP